jgi:uncharacterized protein YpuA (DUF1002 family)
VQGNDLHCGVNLYYMFIGHPVYSCSKIKKTATGTGIPVDQNHRITGFI